MTRWIIEKSQGFTDVGLLKISESVRTYTYLILSSQASAKSHIVGNRATALTAQKAFLNNLENNVNQRVDIREDIKRYQDTLSYASSKVNYSIGENVYMHPSDMNVNIRSGTVGYNDKIFVSDSGLNLGKSSKVNTLESETPKHTPVPKAAHKEVLTNAGITLTGYHPAPGTPGLLHRNVCPAPGLLHNRKCLGARPIKDNVPGARHLYQLAFKHEHC